MGTCSTDSILSLSAGKLNVLRVYVCVYPVVKQGRQTISPVDAFVASGYSADAVEPLRVASFSEDAYFAPYLKGEAATPASTNKQPTSSA